MISIITPTHDPKFLKELAQSILSQTHSDWEWIILVNGAGKQAIYLDFYKFEDKRIKVFFGKYNLSSVGFLKKQACEFATGDVIVEVDHDDLLVSTCLEKVAKAFEDPEVGFVYSDDAKLGPAVPYDIKWGWKTSFYKHNGQNLLVQNGQTLTPGRLGYIWYAPDHVRAWRKSVYETIGGHDEQMEVCDDLDLMHRLYLATKFKHIPEVLYIYRVTGNNTWLRRNALIQQKTVEIYNKNVFNLSVRFADLHNLLKIDLCGGFDKPAGFTSIDKFGGDIIHDLENGIPLPENSVGVMRAHDALEHVRNQQLLMNEIHRVLAPGGILISQTPSTDGRGAWQDPTHVSFWNQNSFWYWTRKEQAKYIRNDKLFRECALYTSYPTQWHEENKIPYVTAHLEKI